MTISQMAQSIAQRELSSRDLVTRYIETIEKNAHLSAVIELNPDAVTIAERLDDSAGSGALHGVPILVKDNVNTGDRMRTSAGSVALAENVADEDAEAVKLLRKAGAVIIGKANMTEFANYMVDFRTGTPMPNGYSSRGGQTVSTYGADVDPSGSSTGSAVAVAAGLCAAAVGSETYGSIISPSQRAGIVGIKPSAGLVSSQGVIPISFTLDTLGPMARCVEDAALLLGVLAGRQYDTSQRSGVRVGVFRNGTDKADPEWLTANESLLGVMRGSGMDCIDLTDHDIDDSFVFPIMRHEFRHGIDKYLQSQNNPTIPQSLAEIIAYNEANADAALKYGQSNLIAANEIGINWVDAPEYKAAISAREASIRSLLTVFDTNRLDVILMLSAHCGLAAACGFPSITLPIGTTPNGLPIGSCLLARPFAEDVLIGAALSIEASLR
ncbi:MAG: amidase family protein [Defluviitaleaceae bacterium]|nr:amidase family protein [Defluviitaleaceae bacterium]